MSESTVFDLKKASYIALRVKLQELREYQAKLSATREALEKELTMRNQVIDESLGAKAAGLVNLEKRARLDVGFQAARMAAADEEK